MPWSVEDEESHVLLIPKNDLKAYLGGNLERKLADAYRILVVCP